MKTKKQKTKYIEEGIEDLKKSEVIVVADFTGLSTHDLSAFRKIAKEMGGVFRVVKKRLLKFMLQGVMIDIEAKEKFEGQTGVVFSSKPIEEIAGAVYTFAKSHETFKVLGGLNLKEKQFVEASNIIAIGKLPGREVLLSQLLGVLTGPIRSFMYVLQERVKKVEQSVK